LRLLRSRYYSRLIRHFCNGYRSYGNGASGSASRKAIIITQSSLSTGLSAFIINMGRWPDVKKEDIIRSVQMEAVEKYLDLIFRHLNQYENMF
jgi:hypothetical protein